MKIPTIRQLGTSPHPVRFVRYQSNKLWYAAMYVVEDGEFRNTEVFQFPIPIHETDDASFPAEDKPVRFMRWMRKHLEYVQRAIDRQSGGGPPSHDPPDYSDSMPSGATSRSYGIPRGALVK